MGCDASVSDKNTDAGRIEKERERRPTLLSSWVPPPFCISWPLSPQNSQSTSDRRAEGISHLVHTHPHIAYPHLIQKLSIPSKAVPKEAKHPPTQTPRSKLKKLSCLCLQFLFRGYFRELRIGLKEICFP